MEDEKNTYYSINIAPVRFHETLSFGAKFIYAEISALCNKEGYCWATNTYFTKLFNVDERTIRRWLSDLREAGFIRVDIEDSHLRKIFLTIIDVVRGDGQYQPTPGTKMSGGTDENVLPCNNTSNSKLNNKKKPFAPVAEKTLPERIKGLSDFIKNIDKELLSAWELAYSHINITKHMAKAVAWALSNPKDAPKSDYKRFLNAWLARDESKEVNKKARDHQFGGDDPDRFNFKHK